MLEHLVEADFEPAIVDAPEEAFVPLKKMSASKVLDAKMKTSDWLRDIGASSDEEVVSEAQKDHARSAFKVMSPASGMICPGIRDEADCRMG